jgi:hypothetical protein
MMDAVKYDGSDQHDWLLAQWYVEVKTNGDLENLFFKNNRAISKVLAYFQRDTYVFFQVREGKIVRMAWLEPHMTGGSFGLWITRGLRGRVETIHWIEAACLIGFELYPVLLAVTKQQNLVDSMQRFGYTFVGSIPYLWDGETAWVLSLVKEDLPHERRKQRRRVHAVS